MTEAERQLSSILSEFARTMLTDFPIQGILDHLVQRIVDILPISAAGVTLISPMTAPHYVAASNDSALRFEELQSELGEGPCVASYQSGEPVMIEDLRDEERFHLFVPRALDIGLAAVFTFPLRQGPNRLGALDLYRDTVGTLTGEDMVTAQTLADVTSAYLLNAKARSDLQDSSDRFLQSSMHDALTGLPNRILLLERIEHAIIRSGRSKKLVAVLFIDLDRFKEVNDVHGHQVGDELLIAVAERIGGVLRPADTLARLSGDEFVVLCEELDHIPQVELVASRILAALDESFDLVGCHLEVAASIGIAFAGHACRDPDQLLHAADVAMYQVKRKGGASHQIIDLRAQRLAEYDLGLQSSLANARARGELRIEYQPIVRTGDAGVTCVEALLRWDHPTRGGVAPSIMIPLAEQSGLIIDIGRWVLEQACIDRKGWSGHPGAGSLVMAVNVSAHQLMAPDFVSTVAAVLRDTDTDPSHLTLEITEGVLVRDTQRAHNVLTDLKGLGVLLALDDFGTGYSSLSYLKRFPVDIVKIDQSFITDVVRDKSSHAIVSKTIELAHLLGLEVICEGVETKEQHATITDLEGDFCQGFYFARPMTAELVEDLRTVPV
jgi:diguanylate cyclase (GGDEF)-like protein